MVNNKGKGNDYISEEELARKRAYEEYLSLRENRSQKKNIKDDTLYGEYVASGHKENALEGAAKGEIARAPRIDRIQRGVGSERGVKSNKTPIAEAGRKNRADSLSKKERKAANLGITPKNKNLRRALIIVGALAVLLGGVITVGLTVVKSTLDNIGRVELNPDMIGIDPQVDQDLSAYRNIAILGIDARDMGNDENSRSDSMIVASINDEKDEIQMFSVVRDTILDLGDGTPGLDKATHAYAYGGPTKALYMLNHNLDLNIKEVVVVNWKAVADTIDALGGIDIEIQQSEIQQMNKYIKDTAKNIGGDDTLIEAPGKQTLNGVQAVTYSRIRKDAATGDFRRNERMKIVVKETFEKAKKMDYSALKKITKKVLPELKTNMSSADIMALMMKLNSFDMTSSTVGWPYTPRTYNGGGSYQAPVTLVSNVSQLHEEFFGQEGYTPTETVQEISSRISAMTGFY